MKNYQIFYTGLDGNPLGITLHKEKNILSLLLNMDTKLKKYTYEIYQIYKIKDRSKFVKRYTRYNN